MMVQERREMQLLQKRQKLEKKLLEKQEKIRDAKIKRDLEIHQSQNDNQIVELDSNRRAHLEELERDIL